MQVASTDRTIGSLHVPTSMLRPEPGTTSAAGTDGVERAPKNSNTAMQCSAGWQLALMVLLALWLAAADVQRFPLTPVGLCRVVAADFQGPFLRPLIKAGLQICTPRTSPAPRL